MKANNLSISIPYMGCDKNCPYCVSKMTGSVQKDLKLFKQNMIKVKSMAELTQVTSVSITSKGEPLLNVPAIEDVLYRFYDMPIELQTNGLVFLKRMSLINFLSDAGVDVFAISMDKIEDFETLKIVIQRIHLLNKTVRITMNITDMLPDPESFTFFDYINQCRDMNIEQLSLRQITKANYTDITKTHEWIDAHVENNSYYKQLINQFENTQQRLIRKLPYGASVYDIHGIGFTYFDYCIQDTNNDDDIRSIIYMEDGHLYTSWNSKASKLF